MKTRILLIVMLAFIGLSGRGQVTFQKTFQAIFTPYPTEQAVGLVQLSNGDYMMTTDSLQIHCSNITARNIKTDSLGREIWNNEIDGGYPGRIEKTVDGGVIIASSYSNSFLLMKMDSLGNHQWTKWMGAPTNCIVNSGGYVYYDHDFIGQFVKQMDDKGYIISCLIYDNSDSLSKYLLIKTDSLGTIIWSKFFDKNYSLRNGCTIALAGHGASQGFVFCTHLSDSTAFSTTKLVVTRVDNNGNIVWSNNYVSSYYYQHGYYISSTNDHGFIITGSLADTGQINNLDWVLMVKIDSGGVVQWAKGYESLNPYFTWGIAVKPTTDNGYIVGGSSALYGHVAMEHSILLKTDSVGNIQFSKSYFGNNNFCYTTDVIQAMDGGYAFCGDLYDTIPNLRGKIYFVKTDRNGNVPCFDSSFTLVPHDVNFISHPWGNELTIPVNSSAWGFYMSHDSIVSKDICHPENVEEIISNDKILVYPNPFSTQATLTLQGTYHNPSLLIYNLIGQEVSSIPIGTNNQVTIPRSNLPAGIYFYKVKEDNKEVLGIGKMVISDN